MHTQVASCAEQIIGVRSAAVPADVRAAVDDHTLVKTWAMRGTLHLLRADEYPMWVAAMTVKEQAARRTTAWEKYHGISLADAQAVTDAIGEVLPGNCFTREELGAAVAAHLKRADLAERLSSGWGSVLKPSACYGLLCFGPPRGRNVTFVSPRHWIKGKWKEPDGDVAMRTVLARFLAAYGPASVDDFARWWGVVPPVVRPLFNEHADLLAEVVVDGKRLWMTREHAAALENALPARGAWLLPGFDPYITGSGSIRKQLVPPGFETKVSRPGAWISAIAVVDGRVVGVWTSETKKGRATITVEPFIPPKPAAKQALRVAGEAYERLWGVPVTVAWA
ncbi:MAG: AlkZ family DNA glycosylase [Actinobacteria bacterium]|nr:AlkZ family DNA glycosylase [Actinomycetota bacterium]